MPSYTHKMAKVRDHRFGDVITPCVRADLSLSCVCRTGPNGMLTIFSPRGGADAGIYRCNVTDGLTSQSRDYVVTVQRQ